MMFNVKDVVEGQKAFNISFIILGLLKSGMRLDLIVAPFNPIRGVKI